MDNEHVSPRQEEYIKNHRRHHHLVALCRFLAFFLFLVLWEVSTALHWIDAFIFSSPSRICLDAFVPIEILCEFVFPEINSALWGVGIPASGVSMPIATMNKNGNIIFLQPNIRVSNDR